MSVRLPQIVPGDTYPLRFTFKDADGNPVDATGWVIQVMLKTDPTLPDAQAVYDESTTGAGADALAGIIRTPIPHDDTQDLTPGFIYLQARRTIAGTPPDVRTLKLEKVKVAEAVIDGA